ncbi:hypothetical protein CEXT_202571 [Caerostris extrusa]|uniref:Uncharacterized protein n=1 Tax=Caerostris extrusa TaxID=172846 RepID=A0AAV4RR13_CAEEX|nr:hypothetical protein CEXT_202571 [Caerostris extrusa]
MSLSAVFSKLTVRGMHRESSPRTPSLAASSEFAAVVRTIAKHAVLIYKNSSLPSIPIFPNLDITQRTKEPCVQTTSNPWTQLYFTPISYCSFLGYVAPYKIKKKWGWYIKINIVKSDFLVSQRQSSWQPDSRPRANLVCCRAIF